MIAGLCVGSLAFNHFQGHVADSAHGRGVVGVADNAGGSKVGHFGACPVGALVLVAVDEDVVWLEVTVNHASAVGIGDGLPGLYQHLEQVAPPSNSMITIW